MKWVTWKNIGVDRMASIWLIRRWIDPTAEFNFISVGETVEGIPAHLFDLSSQPLDLFRGARQIRQNPDRFVKQNGAKAF